MGGVGWYACHDKVMDVHGDKKGFIATTPWKIVVFYSDRGWVLCRPANFPQFGNLNVGHHGLPLEQNLNGFYGGVSVGMCGSFRHDSPVAWRTRPAERLPLERCLPYSRSFGLGSLLF